MCEGPFVQDDGDIYDDQVRMYNIRCGHILRYMDEHHGSTGGDVKLMNTVKRSICQEAGISFLYVLSTGIQYKVMGGRTYSVSTAVVISW